LGSSLATVVLIAIVMFLAADVGFYLYNPDRLVAALPVCTLNIISGSTKVQTQSTVAWEKAEDGMKLEPGSRIRTAPDARASLTFAQGTTTTLDPGTDLIVAQLEGNQDTRPDTVILKQLLGKTWNQVTKRPDGSDYFQIQTPSADVKVHGTLFSAEVDASGKALIQTTEGRVSVSAQGQEVQVPAGQQTEVEPGAAPSAPAPVPPARNELVFTINKPAVGLVTDPSGSSTGYLPDGSPLNQISGSRLSPSEDLYQTIRIYEPSAGDYTIVLRGATDGSSSLSIEGFAQGQSGFLHAESCNITAANDLVLKLHLDVLNGLVRGATVLGLEPKEATAATSPPESAANNIETPAVSNVSKKEAATDQGEGWVRFEGATRYSQLVAIASIVILFAVLFVVWRKQ
jgi:hypothetical protein